MRIDWPTFGEMMKLMRAYVGDYSQTKLAEGMKMSRGSVSKWEANDPPCPPDMRMLVKHVTGLHYLPTCDEEVPEYEDALDDWYDLIYEGKWEEAKIFREKIVCIKAFPFLKSLNTTFELYDCRLLIGTGELDKAKQIIDKHEKCLGELRDIQKYRYYYNHGIYNGMSGSINEALGFFKDGLNLGLRISDSDISINYNIAFCYVSRGAISCATDFLEDVYETLPKGRNDISLFWLYNLHGNNLTTLGFLKKAEKVNDKSYEFALEIYTKNESEESKLILGSVHISYGRMYRRAKKHRKANEYFDKAIHLISKDQKNHLESIYQKGRCLVEIKDMALIPMLVSEGLNLSKNNKVYTLAFKALECFSNLNEENAEYIEEKILPYLLETNSFHLIIDYATVLSDFYKTRGQGYITKSYRMSELALSIHKKFLERGII